MPQVNSKPGLLDREPGCTAHAFLSTSSIMPDAFLLTSSITPARSTGICSQDRESIGAAYL
eukprot:scaffold29074_cov22-Tisochrysis_lutea.AAC.2